MFTITTRQTDEPENYSDFKSLADWGLETQCKLRYPGGAVLANSATASNDTVVASSTLKLPDSGAATNWGALPFSIPDTWSKGTLKASIHYTASASGGDYVVQALWYTTTVGDTINTGSTSASDTLSSVGGAWELASHTFSAERTIDPSDTYATLRLRRDGTDGSDTDTSDLHILEVTITYEPDRY